MASWIYGNRSVELEGTLVDATAENEEDRDVVDASAGLRALEAAEGIGIGMGIPR